MRCIFSYLGKVNVPIMVGKAIETVDLHSFPLLLPAFQEVNSSVVSQHSRVDFYSASHHHIRISWCRAVCFSSSSTLSVKETIPTHA